jgi:hypothetical protein
MRKAVLILLACLGFATAQAQVTLKPGILAGLNLSKLTDTDLGLKPDFNIGVYGALKLSKFYTFQEEISYSRQGAKGTVSSVAINFPYITNVSADYDVTLQYISATTINKFNIRDAYILFGPQVDVLIASSFKANGNNFGGYNKGQDIDFGLTGGFGYSFTKNIAVEARIKKGFLKVLESGTSNYNPTITNLVFQFGIAYTFGKK